MADLLNGLKRDKYCGEYRASDIDRVVTIMGFISKHRDLGNLVFMDIRDRTGLVQVSVDDTASEEVLKKASSLRAEYVVAVTGKVISRGDNINKNLPTGEVEIIASDIKILAEAEVPPFVIKDDVKASEALRLKYRYLDLRRPVMQRNILMRDKATKIIRDYMFDNNFLDIETPFLGKSTPEGARDYLVPSRVHPGEFYALPQSPQLYKQLLMISGFDRYYQVARCFRDEDLRANRQPEFTQVDMEMSFVEDENDVMNMAEGLIKDLFNKCVGVEFKENFKRMSYVDAMEMYGSDKPDTRFDMKLVNISEEVKNTEFIVFKNALETGSVRLINAKGKAQDFTRKAINKLQEEMKTFGAKGLAYILLKEDGSVSSSVAKFLSEEELNAIYAKANAEKGDALFIIASDNNKVVYDSLGNLRCHLANKFDLIDKDTYDILWVTQFPLLEYDEEEKRYVAIHHPFTAPMDEDVSLLETDPLKVRSKAYDLVINGQEAGGGSVRIHTTQMQEKIFNLLGFTAEDIERKFSFFVDAFKYGAPPHGGLAFGLDRLVMILTGTESIKDVIAFPKVQNASCLMTEAPSQVDDKQLDELGIEVAKEEND